MQPGYLTHPQVIQVKAIQVGSLPPLSPIQTQILTTINADIKDLKRDNLAIKMILQECKMKQNEEVKSEVKGKHLYKVTDPNILVKLKLSGSNLQPYLTREEKEKNILPRKCIMSCSKKIDLSPSTLAKFYQHQKSPHFEKEN
ncbi:hypothetical protein Glove_279g58 [Diversispora epigaea]|uniref:Uncharacterized protein n=1 Tax=Diversispora epigaea TaxID=1348612 RepID=A0A397I3I5_9GLOM|nr:hypothetical protein Glove_279g58 [Diversispora epigaea]